MNKAQDVEIPEGKPSVMRTAFSGMLRSDGASVLDDILSSQVFLFVMVGAAGALAFVLLSSTLVGLATGLPDWLASGACYAALVVPVYLLHRRFSFRSDAGHLAAFPRYVAVQLSGIVLASLFSFLAYGVFELPALLASCLVIGLTSGVNFAVLKIWAFPDSR